MPDMEDFFAFTHTTGDSGGSSGGPGGMGCLVWAMVVYALLTLIGKFS